MNDSNSHKENDITSIVERKRKAAEENKETYVCIYCNFKYQTKVSLRHHTRHKHPEQNHDELKVPNKRISNVLP